jgi:hypothetical protein
MLDYDPTPFNLIQHGNINDASSKLTSASTPLPLSIINTKNTAGVAHHFPVTPSRGRTEEYISSLKSTTTAKRAKLRLKGESPKVRAYSIRLTVFDQASNPSLHIVMSIRGLHLHLQR